MDTEKSYINIYCLLYMLFSNYRTNLNFSKTLINVVS
jgi:hypothetical protein